MIGYLLNIIFSTIIFAGGIFAICRFGDSLPSKKIDRAFLLAILGCYILNILFSITPLNGLNLPNCTPLSNVSPFLFALAGIALVLPETWQRRLFSLFSIFFLPMFFAAICISLEAIIFRGPFWAFTIPDALAHIFFSLFCFYLLKTGQVSIDRKGFLVSCVIVYGAAFLALLLNLVLKTRLFGLTFFGGHNIYGLVLTDSGSVSALIYFLGLTDVMLFGGVIREKIIRKQIGSPSHDDLIQQ